MARRQERSCDGHSIVKANDTQNSCGEKKVREDEKDRRIECEQNFIVSLTLSFHFSIGIRDVVVFEMKRGGERERERAVSRRARCASVLIEQSIWGQRKKSGKGERRRESVFLVLHTFCFPSPSSSLS